MALILLANDDGPEAPGLFAMARALAGRHTLRVAVPDGDRSGAGHAITLLKPVIARRFEIDGLDAWKVDGTPVDAVKLAITTLWDTPPDLVVSGINFGANVGENIFYSGTVGAAAEAVIGHVPAVAMSLDMGPAEFEYAARLGVEIVDAALANGLPKDTILNVNVPNRPEAEINGLRLTHQGRSGYKEYYIPAREEEGLREYRVDGDMIIRDESTDYDAAALAAGWVSVTPLTLSMEHPSFAERMRSWSGISFQPDA